MDVSLRVDVIKPPLRQNDAAAISWQSPAAANPPLNPAWHSCNIGIAMPITIQRLSADDIRSRQADLVELLCDTVDNGSSVNFLAPMDRELAAAFWERIAVEAASDRRVVVAAIDGSRLVGSVQLEFAAQPNGGHRAEVQKLLVHSSARRRGIGTQLMNAIEHEARSARRRLIVLDTEQGSPAEALYERAGYRRAGGIPEFALIAAGNRYTANVIFYKLFDTT
jgi:acetyltransferase